MNDVDGTTDVGVDTTTATEPTSYIGQDGTFSDGWRENYVPEDVRGEKIFDRVKTIQGMAKSLANAERLVGADKILKPSDKFGDKEWEDYHRAGGWTGEPIPLKAPDGLPEGIWSDERATKFSDGFNKLKLTPKQVDGIMEIYNADLASQLTDMGNNSETTLAELKSNLLAKWGNAYSQHEHNAEFALSKGSKGDDELKQRIVDKYGKDPDFIEVFANLGGEFSESGSIPVSKLSPTPVDIQAKINEIQASEAFNNPMHPDHANTMKTINRLYKEKASIRQPA